MHDFFDGGPLFSAAAEPQACAVCNCDRDRSAQCAAPHHQGSGTNGNGGSGNGSNGTSTNSGSGGRGGRRRWLQHAAAVWAGAVAAGWAGGARAGYNVFTGEYTVPAAELRAQLGQRFPVQLAYGGGLFALALRNPRLALDAPRNRLQVTSDLEVGNPLFLPQPVSGVLSISSGLRYDAATRAVRLHQPQAEQLQLQGLSERDGRRLKDVGALVAREVLADYPLHTFRPEELRMGLKTLEPGAITVLDDGLKVQLN